jgi:cysteinyl-tRNA synthetase
MAKSTGHVVDLATAIERLGGMAVRLFYLRAHYRSPLEYSEQLLEDAGAALERLRAYCRRSAASEASPEPDVLSRFTEAMDDDFNTPDALAVVFDTVKEGNRRLDEGLDAAPITAAFSTMVAVLGIELQDSEDEAVGEELAEIAVRFGVEGDSLACLMEALLERRAQARAERDWTTADAIRDDLARIGVIVEDAADGARWHRG